MDSHKTWSYCGWSGAFTFGKVISFASGLRGAPAKNGRSLTGAWASAQSLLSCWTSASHQAQPTHPLTPPAEPIPVPYDARQHLALALLTLFSKHKQGGTRPPNSGFSLATWLGIAATAALSTPVAYADCECHQVNGGRPPAALMQTWQHLHTANCSNNILLALACAQQHLPQPQPQHVADASDAAASTEPSASCTKHSTTSQQLLDGTPLEPPAEPYSFELNNPIWQCHSGPTASPSLQGSNPQGPNSQASSMHQLSLTATEPLGVHVGAVSQPTASSFQVAASVAACMCDLTPSCSTAESEHVDWPVLPSAACANECRECEPWCALSAAAGQLWKQIEPSVVGYCQRAMSDCSNCAGDCAQSPARRPLLPSIASKPTAAELTEHSTITAAERLDCMDVFASNLLNNVNTPSSSSTTTRRLNCHVLDASAVQYEHNVHDEQRSCALSSTRFMNRHSTCARSTSLAVIPEEPGVDALLASATQPAHVSCNLSQAVCDDTHITMTAAGSVITDGPSQAQVQQPAVLSDATASKTSQGLGSEAQGLGSETQGVGSEPQGFGSEVKGLGSEVQVVGFQTQGLVGDTNSLACKAACTPVVECIGDTAGQHTAPLPTNTASQDEFAGSASNEESNEQGAGHIGIVDSLVRLAHAPVEMLVEGAHVPQEAHGENMLVAQHEPACSTCAVCCGGAAGVQACQQLAVKDGVAGCAEGQLTHAFSKYMEWRRRLLGTEGLELTLAVLGVPDLGAKARNDISRLESTLRLDEMPRVLQALEWDMHELQSQASLITDGLEHFTNHPAAESWEVAEGHLETLDDYFRKSCTIVGRMPPCTESSRAQVLQLVVPPLLQCSKVCSAGLAKLLTQQAQSGANIRGADVTEQLEMVQRFVHLAAQITQEFRECEIVVPNCDYSQELSHAVCEVYAAFTASAKRLQSSAIGGMAQPHATRTTAELDRVLAMGRLWKEAHKLGAFIGKVWPDLHGSVLSQLAECQKHAAESFAKLLRSPQYSQQAQRGKKGANTGASVAQSPSSGAAADEGGWSDKSVSVEEIARLKRVLDLLWSLLHYSKTTYKELMQQKPQDKADARRYAAIQQAFFDVALSLAKRASRWTGPRVRSLHSGALGDLKRCQSDVLRFIVEWDKSCVGVPGHKQMANLQELTFRLVRQYMALQRQSSRDSLSTPRNKPADSDATPSLSTRPAAPAGTPTESTSELQTLTSAPLNNSPFANLAAQPASTTAAFNALPINALSSSPMFMQGMLPYPPTGPLPHSPFMPPHDMMNPSAFTIPAVTLMGPAATQQAGSTNPFAMAVLHAHNPPINTLTAALAPATPATLQQLPEDYVSRQAQQAAPVTVPTLNLATANNATANTSFSPFASPVAQHHTSSNLNNSPFTSLAIHSQLQSVAESLTPGRSTATTSTAGSTATYLPPISESIPSTTHFSSTHTMATTITHISTAMCSHTSSQASNCTTAVSPYAPHSPTTQQHDEQHIQQHQHQQHSSDKIVTPSSAAFPAVLPDGTAFVVQGYAGNVVGVAGGVQQLVASPRRAGHVSLFGARAGLNSAGLVGADMSDMFMTKDNSKGNGAEVLLAASVTNVVDDFWGVKWEEVLGANVKEWFTGKTRLGRGSYGEVYKASYYHADVAVKVLPIRSATVHTVKQEIDVLRSTRHPNVVRFLGACLEPMTPDQPKPTRHLAIVMELCDIGTLHATIAKARHMATRQRDPRVKQFYTSWTTRLDIARGIAAGTAFLHSRHVVHRDLTSYNVLLHYGVPWQAKVADFGLSRDASVDLNYSGDLHSPGWRAPELLVPNSKYTMKADVYSFGVILWELVTLKQPWEEEFDKAQQTGPRGNLHYFIKNEVVTGGRLRFPDADQYGGDLPEAAQVISLAERCWHTNPDDRPTMEEVVKKLEKIMAQVRRRR